jgi:hypothetical protein
MAAKTTLSWALGAQISGLVFKGFLCRILNADPNAIYKQNTWSRGDFGRAPLIHLLLSGFCNSVDGID